VKSFKFITKDILYYLISNGFVIISIFLILNNTLDSKGYFIGLMCLLFFGGGSIIYYFLKREDEKKRIGNDTLVIFESRKRASIYFLGSLIFVIVGSIMMINSHYFKVRTNPTFAFFGGLLSVLFFGLVLIYASISIIKPKKVIELCSNGIYVQYGLMKSLIFISWNDITEIVETNFMSNNFISIFLQNPKKYIQKESFLNALNSKIIGTPFNINPKITDYSSIEILNFLNNKLKENKN
jgi:hypothetical protein